MNPCVAREYIESCLKIRTKSGAVVPFRLNAAQQKLYAVAKRQQDEGKPVRIIILKARQLGFPRSRRRCSSTRAPRAQT